VDTVSRVNPQAVIPHIDRHWGLLAQFDSALVSSADGMKVAWYQRDPDRFKKIMKRTSLLHARLSREWPELSRRYRAAMDELTAPETWRRTFAAAESGRAADSGDPAGSGEPGDR
jgi:galactofuranosylgalactofuranosylrhamnosyl-N-acetylglucosaminyl-diphospho-decaprenol beta-1,5/1,6-galactofuranosyltransferase